MDKIKKNFGFGLMRLPMNGEEVNIEETKEMVDAFLNAGFPGIMTVLSGMGNMEQMKDNISFMKDFKPLDKTELAAVEKVQKIFKSKNLIPCTACRYCTDGCPKHISIPALFADMNAKQIYHDRNADYYYNDVHTSEGRKASDCIKCGKCEKACPQHLPIRKLLADVAEAFEKDSEE